MSWDAECLTRVINVPFESGDLVEFARLLRVHPEYLSDARWNRSMDVEGGNGRTPSINPLLSWAWT